MNYKHGLEYEYDFFTTRVKKTEPRIFKFLVVFEVYYVKAESFCEALEIFKAHKKDTFCFGDVVTVSDGNIEKKYTIAASLSGLYFQEI